jgi:exonuclease VII large subunit
LWNDVFDWNKDLRFNTPTYFLSEAARRKTELETVTAWVAREGFAWGTQVLSNWMQDLKHWARPLNSPSLEQYLEFRQRLLAEQSQQLQADLKQLAQLAAAVGPRVSL